MLAVLVVRLKPVLPFLRGDEEDADMEGVSERPLLGDERRCFFCGDGAELVGWER